jgi:hypothetical protein
MHYPGHLREAFLDWVEDGCPPTAVVEVEHEPVTMPADTFLYRMMRCSDVLPEYGRELVHAALDDDDDADVWSYAQAARLLLDHQEPARHGVTVERLDPDDR